MRGRIKELYLNGLVNKTPSIDAEGVLLAVQKGWITVRDAVSLIGLEDALGTVKRIKLAECSKACNKAIVSGVDIQIGDRTDHFNLDLEDQSNINNLFRVVELGGTEFPYQADDGTCMVYTAGEIAQIYVSAQKHITEQTAYYNALKQVVQGLSTVEEVMGVRYGMELPGPAKNALMEKLSVADAQMGEIIAKLSARSGV